MIEFHALLIDTLKTNLISEDSHGVNNEQAEHHFTVWNQMPNQWSTTFKNLTRTHTFDEQTWYNLVVGYHYISWHWDHSFIKKGNEIEREKIKRNF